MPWATALEWLKLPSRTLWGLLVVDTLVLWGPRWFTSGLGLEVFINDQRNWLGVGFLALLTATVPQTVVWAYRIAHNKWEQHRNLERLQQRLHDLSEAEKIVLRKYMSNDSRTQTLDFADGVARGLQAEHVIAQASSVSRGLTYFDYNIQPWARRYLREHPELLGAPDQVNA